MIKLSKIFSREKPLMYFSMWNDSDRMGWKDFLGYTVEHNLFIVPPQGQKGSVWYSPEELNKVDELLNTQITDNLNFINSLIDRLDKYWIKIIPYLSNEQDIQNNQEFSDYYNNLVTWWSAMSTAFTIPDKSFVEKDIKEKILEYRSISEKYTEKMSTVMKDYFLKSYPELAQYVFFVHPKEIKNIQDENVLSNIRNRKNGCCMLDEKIFSLSELDKELSEYSLELDIPQTEAITEFKGTSSYKGKVSGPVKIVRGFADLSNVQEGDVLVTEMTNPEYVSAMKKAVAIVTDEGGITCHASIASRELKIVCIVGTKVATQVLKDGDMVEVDADKGIVRKI